MVETILSSPFVREIILPFLLVFAMVFAVLQKTEIFGKGKRQADAIVALVTGLLVVSVGYATNIIVNLIPFLAVSLVVILVFLLLWGMAYKEGAFEVPEKIRWLFGGLAAVVVIIAVLYFSGGWTYIKDMISGETSAWITNIVFIVLIGIAIAVVVGFGGEKKA